MGNGILGSSGTSGAYGPDGPVHRTETPQPAGVTPADYPRTDLPICGKIVRLTQKTAEKLNLSPKLRWLVEWVEMDGNRPIQYRLTCLDQERPPLTVKIWAFELE